MRRLLGSAVACAVAALGALLLPPAPAYAVVSANGPNGQRLSVPKAAGIALAGETLTVTGKGYDTDKGIYVGFCVDNGPGQMPSPCGGGVDMSGASGASHWISSNPPSYGEGLAVPYGSGGTFSVSLKVSRKIGDNIDCTVTKCAVVTRSDHTRTADRSQDVRTPITFAAAGGGAPPPGNKPDPRVPAQPPAQQPPGNAPEDPRTPAAAPTTAAGQPAPTGTADPAAAVTPGTAGPTPLQASRVSTSDSSQTLWMVTVSALVVLLIAALALRAFRRRKEP